MCVMQPYPCYDTYPIPSPDDVYTEVGGQCPAPSPDDMSVVGGTWDIPMQDGWQCHYTIG
jgi:hypothetical protein